MVYKLIIFISNIYAVVEVVIVAVVIVEDVVIRIIKLIIFISNIYAVVEVVIVAVVVVEDAVIRIIKLIIFISNIYAVVENNAAETSFDEMLEESLRPIYNGEKVTGIVAAISGTEITVDLGAKYSGFIPTTEFTDAGVKVEDAVKVGDEIEAIVVRVNDVEGTAQLSKKRLDSQKFWTDIEAR